MPTIGRRFKLTTTTMQARHRNILWLLLGVVVLSSCAAGEISTLRYSGKSVWSGIDGRYDVQVTFRTTQMGCHHRVVEIQPSTGQNHAAWSRLIAIDHGCDRSFELIEPRRSARDYVEWRRLGP